MKQIAIIGATASGKTSLSIDIAHKTNSVILSLDSLSVYKQINIASAKPTLKEREGIVHFGINEVNIDEKFDVIEFLNCYKRASAYAKEIGKNLIIVGGTGFYLKILIEGISKGFKDELELEDTLSNTYKILKEIDPIYMSKIKENDKYRVQKAFNIYKQSGLSPSTYFIKNPKIALAPNLELYEISWQKDELRNRIKQRTKIMLEEGIIEEVISLEREFHRGYNAMSSIGIVETLAYLDGKLSKKLLEEKIATNTAKLAKRQTTFNKNQFLKNKTTNIIENLNKAILKDF